MNGQDTTPADSPDQTPFDDTRAGFDLDHIFTYHPPKGDEDIAKYKNIRDCGKDFAKAIMRHTPPGADQAAAIRKVREAVMTANAAIALEGRL